MKQGKVSNLCSRWSCLLFLGKREREWRQNHQGQGKLPGSHYQAPSTLRPEQHQRPVIAINHPTESIIPAESTVSTDLRTLQLTCPPQKLRFTMDTILTAAFNLSNQNLIQEGMEGHVAEMHLKEKRSLMLCPCQ